MNFAKEQGWSIFDILLKLDVNDFENWKNIITKYNYIELLNFYR